MKDFLTCFAAVAWIGLVVYVMGDDEVRGRLAFRRARRDFFYTPDKNPGDYRRARGAVPVPEGWTEKPEETIRRRRGHINGAD